MDRRPDATARPVGLGANHRGRSAIHFSPALEIGHVLDRHFDRDLHGLDAAGVDDGYRPVRATEELRRFAQWALRGRQADPLRLGFGDGGEPLEAERQVGSALRLRHRMDLVDDHPPDGW